MTNFEYYKETILEITNSGCDVAIVNNKPISCRNLECCTECQLKNHRGCYLNLTKWFCEEHKEQPKLTKKERQCFELVEGCWVVRNKNGSLNLFSKRPTKLENCWFSRYDDYAVLTLFNLDLSFITWEDEEPWSIEDLLKLEVEE